MKKPTQKRVKECLKDIDNNFSELIDAIIYYEQKNMDDWSYDIIGYIEKLSNEKEIELLIKDFNHRKDEHFYVYSYQKLWWSLINEKSEKIVEKIVEFLKTSKKGKIFQEILEKWYESLDEGINTKDNILIILNKCLKNSPHLKII